MNYVPTFKERLTFLVEVLNEALFLIMCYHIVLFIGLVWDFEPRRRVGKSLLTLLFTFLAVNVAIIVWVSVKGFMRASKLKKFKQKREKILKARDTNIKLIQSAQIMNRVIFKDNEDSHLYEQNKSVYDQEINFVKVMSNRELKNITSTEQHTDEKMLLLYSGATFPTAEITSL